MQPIAFRSSARLRHASRWTSIHLTPGFTAASAFLCARSTASYKSRCGPTNFPPIGIVRVMSLA